MTVTDHDLTGYPLPQRLVRAAQEILGEKSVAWLAGIPDIARHCAQQWSCNFAAPFESLSYNYVAPGRRMDGSAVVLKVCIPGPEYATEANCLAEYSGDGALRLLARDDARQVLLLERLFPGAALTAHPDVETATHIAAGLMRRLWRPSQQRDSYPTVAVWMQHMADRSPGVLGAGHPFPQSWVSRALATYAELAQDQPDEVLLHGDLHMDNILSAQREPWLVIDPKGVIGPPIWETGPLILNAFPNGCDSATQRTPIHRIARQLAAELAFDVKSVAAWGMVRSVLSGWWTVEDHGYDWEDSIAIAGILNDMIC